MFTHAPLHTHSRHVSLCILNVEPCIAVLFADRVNGQLAVSRAFGDLNFKFSKEESEMGGGSKELLQRGYVLAPATTATPVTCR